MPGDESGKPRSYLAEALARSEWANRTSTTPEEDAFAEVFSASELLRVSEGALMHAIRSFIEKRFD